MYCVVVFIFKQHRVGICEVMLYLFIRVEDWMEVVLDQKMISELEEGSRIFIGGRRGVRGGERDICVRGSKTPAGMGWDEMRWGINKQSCCQLEQIAYCHARLMFEVGCLIDIDNDYDNDFFPRSTSFDAKMTYGRNNGG